MPDAPIPLDADPNRLAQVVGNLLANAAKYTPENGTITLAVQREEDVAVLRVTDNGIGIAAHALPNLFQMFRQGRNGASLAQEGLGIGLHLVKHLTEMHGGSVTAESGGPGQGSIFTLRLPVARSGWAPAPSDTVGSNQAPGRTPLRVLVVDDNRDAAESLAAVLELDGHVVETLHDGPSALAAAGRFHPDLALLDIGMPGMDGYALAQALRRAEGLGQTVLVALTGWGTPEDRERARDAGFDHHLTKPVGLDKLKQLAGDVARASDAQR
jgi:CheY-like chemotaxis protein/anti-sigma regulatory factor (Ser/Thr protein kinase)